MTTHIDLGDALIAPLTAEEQQLQSSKTKPLSLYERLAPHHKSLLKARRQNISWEVLSKRLAANDISITSSTLQRLVSQLNAEARRRSGSRQASSVPPASASSPEQPPNSGSENRPMTVADLRAQTAAIEVPAEAL